MCIHKRVVATFKTQLEIAEVKSRRNLTLENGTRAIIYFVYGRCTTGNWSLAHHAILSIVDRGQSPVQIVYYANVDCLKLVRNLKNNLNVALAKHMIFLVAYNEVIYNPWTPTGKILIESIRTKEKPEILMLTTKEGEMKDAYA